MFASFRGGGECITIMNKKTKWDRSSKTSLLCSFFTFLFLTVIFQKGSSVSGTHLNFPLRCHYLFFYLSSNTFCLCVCLKDEIGCSMVSHLHCNNVKCKNGFLIAEASIKKTKSSRRVFFECFV